MVPHPQIQSTTDWVVPYAFSEKTPCISGTCMVQTCAVRGTTCALKVLAEGASLPTCIPHSGFNPPGRRMRAVQLPPVLQLTRGPGVTCRAHLGSSRRRHPRRVPRMVRPCSHKTLLSLQTLCFLVQRCSLNPDCGASGFCCPRASLPRLCRPPLQLPGGADFLQIPDSLFSGYNHHPVARHSGPPRQPAFLWAEKSLSSKRVGLRPKP